MNTNYSQYQQILSSGQQAIGLKLTTKAQNQLLSYVALLQKWNTAYNLTAVRDPEQMIRQHILDSLTLLPYLQDVKSILDVGTGPGLPGIPLAIARPDISVTLLDSLQKKINFVQHVITSLQLANAQAIQQRIQDLPAEQVTDLIVSRAFASLADFVNLIEPICTPRTKIIAMKGRQEQVNIELQQLPATFRLESIEVVKVPGLDAQRCLVILSKQEE